MAGAGKYGDLKSEIFGKTASRYYRNDWFTASLHESSGCEFKMVFNDGAKKARRTKQMSHQRQDEY